MRIDIRLLLILFVVWVAAFGYRLAHLSFVDINSDALSSYLAALHFWRFGFAEPPNPESDHWMWISKVPWLWCATSLEELFQLRFVIGSLMAPMGAWCVYVNARHRPYSASFFCGLILAFDIGLIDTLVSSFRGYMAPEWISVATVLFVLSRKYVMCAPLVGVMVMIAAGHHPMALGVLLGVLYLGSLHRFDQQIILLGLLGLFLASGFRILALYEIMQCDEGGWSCLVRIAQGSSEAILFGDIVFRLFHDRFWVEMGWGSLFFVFGILLAPKKEFFYWTVLSALGIIILGFGIHTLRPYHLRIVALPMIVLGVLGWERFRGHIPMIWFFSMLLSATPIVGEQGLLKKHDDLAKQLHEVQGLIWIESTVESQLYSPGVGLSAVLSRMPYERFAKETPDEVTLCTVDEKLKKWQKKDVYVVQEIDWGGGFDWARTIFPAQHVKNMQHE